MKHSDLGRTYSVPDAKEKEGGPGSGGQSGDTQGLSDLEEVSSESVKELLEEGNSFEAELLMGIENAPDADQGEVRTTQVPEDDVPGEYIGKEKDR
ncbi:MAG: hypothetical protein ABI811_16675 [Acidobacteriota bacterium]